jgi:arginyl-tRNA synthetase
MQGALTALFKEALAEGAKRGVRKKIENISIVLNIPSQKEHGDYATPLVLGVSIGGQAFIT